MLDRKGKVTSTTDLLIAAAAYKKARLLHLDRDFEMIGSLVGLAGERL
jgi:predicted nucleic acid-binding protein